ncbi:MAG: type II toxin-antitoxin system VapC family toxin [Nitrospiraceae bacterium]|nr:type II toxin-antitoxin system VapC family toxin [Nitrospiraceae bacterium]
MIVLDASVILKWIFDDEDGSERAARWKDAHVAGHEIAAVPDLLFYEIGNVLATKTKLSEAAIAEAFSLLWEFSLERFDLGVEEFHGGIALSRKYKITLYDAVYIELSRRLKCTFVTADRKLYEKVKNIKTVELL